MDPGTSPAYRSRKRPLNDGRPCNPKVKRRLFSCPCPCPNRRAAEAEAEMLQRSLLKLRRRVIARACFMVEAVADDLRLLAEMGSYSHRELSPFHQTISAVLLPAMRACDGAAVAPVAVEVNPDLYESDSTSYDDGLTCGDGDDDDDAKSCEEPPAIVVEKGGRGAALVAVKKGDDAVRGKRRAKANSKYYGPEWAKK